MKKVIEKRHRKASKKYQKSSKKEAETDRKKTRQSIQRVNQWDFDKIIISHGKLITKNAKEVFSNAFQSF